jgi:hypothetical protein
MREELEKERDRIEDSALMQAQSWSAVAEVVDDQLRNYKAVAHCKNDHGGRAAAGDRIQKSIGFCVPSAI